MASTCFAVLVLFLIKQAIAVPGEAVMFMPPLEVRTMDMKNGAFPFVNPQFFTGNQQMAPIMQQQSTMQQSPMQRPSVMSSMAQSSVQRPTMLQPTMQEPTMQQQSFPQFTPQSSVLHHTSVQSTTPEPMTRPHDRHNMTFNDLVEVLNEISDHNKDTATSAEEDSFETRSASPGYGYSAPAPSPSYPPYSSYPSYPRPTYGPPRPSYGSYGPPPPSAYHEPSYAPPPVHHHIAKHGKAGLISSLFKPTATKVASKVSGLLGIVLSLLGGTPGTEFAGFKDIVVNGIIKPLLIAKGGLKSLISKLVVPVIALLLINVEVLITVWWLWDDCPKPTYGYAPPPPPPAYEGHY